MTSDLTLVTGGAGFLGQHVVATLLNSGKQVRVLDISSRNATSDLEWIEGSVTDPQTVREAYEGVSCVIHLAAIPHLWTRHVADFDRVNHRGTQVMLDEAQRRSVSAFVHVSSLTTRISGPTGGEPRLVSESDVPPLDAMLGAYPRSKWLAEEAARKAALQGLPVRIAIPTMPMGPGDFGLTPPSRMVLDFVSGKTPAYLETWMNVADVRDMAAGVVSLLTAHVPPQGVFVAGDNIQLSDLLGHLQKVSGVAMPRAKVPGVVAEAFAVADEFVSTHLTHRPPKAPVTGVRLARRPITFDGRQMDTFLPKRTYALDQTLADLLAWFTREGLWERAT